MTRLKAATPSRAPEDFLRLALRASDAAERGRWARRGLALDADDLAPDTHVLLLRQLYLAHLEAHRLEKALEVARQMGEIGPMRDIAHHDASRILAALGALDDAIAEQRLAARRCPADRRSFHLFSLAVLQEDKGDLVGALSSLERAERWAKGDRVLIHALGAYARLRAGTASPDLAGVVAKLERSRAREGYGRYLLGMIALEMGDLRRAAVHLRAWLRRHAAADAATVVSLRTELRRARTALARIESD